MTTGNSRKWRKVTLPAENMAAVRALISEVGFCLGKGDPVEAFGWIDAKGRSRKIHAHFADGWRATVKLHLGGTASLSQALTIRGEIKGAVV